MSIEVVSLVHLIVLGFWGGVVATEAVIELYPFRRRAFHSQTITLHYWIDLLVELPILCAVVGTGVVATVFAWPLSGVHWLKIGCALGAVAANVLCIVLVVRRKRNLTDGVSEPELWTLTKRIVLSAKLGLPLGLLAAGMGFWLAYQRMFAGV